MKEILEKIKNLFRKNKIVFILLFGTFLIICFSILSFSAGILAEKFSEITFLEPLKSYLDKIISKPIETQEPEAGRPAEYAPQTTQEQAVIKVVKDYSPAVVSIIVTKDLPIIEEYYISPFEGFFNDPFFEIKIPQYRQMGTEKKEIGGGSGFIVSEDGLVLTNKHVVLDEEADYTILTNDGKKFPAKVLARDPVQDIAVLKIENEKAMDKQGVLQTQPFPVVKLGDSSKLEIGQTAVAIGNALGEFRNTVSTGVVSGLARTIIASGGGFVETLEDVIQTDAAINKGNSGGPLLNLRGEVIGINTATVEQAQSIGFAIPINRAKRDIEQVKTLGKITYPFLGVRYVLINEQVKKENNLAVDYGAWVIRGSEALGEAAIYPGSVAQTAGIKENDIILEFNKEKITIDNSLAKIIMEYNPGDEVELKILRQGKELFINLVLGERS